MEILRYFQCKSSSVGLLQHSPWTPHSFRIRLAIGNGGYGSNWIQVCKEVKVLQKNSRTWKEEEQKIGGTGEVLHIRVPGSSPGGSREFEAGMESASGK